MCVCVHCVSSLEDAYQLWLLCLPQAHPLQLTYLLFVHVHADVQIGGGMNMDSKHVFF